MKIKQNKSYIKTDKIFKRKINLKLKQLQEILKINFQKHFKSIIRNIFTKI